MKIGVRAHDLGKCSPVELAKRVKGIGFDGVQLVLNKAFDGETGVAGSLSNDKVDAIYKAFHEQNLDILMVGAYFNPVHSSWEKVDQGVLKFKEHLEYANKFHTEYVGTETGSYNDDQWTYNPKNRTKEALNAVIASFGLLAQYAKAHDTKMAIEGAYGHVCYCPQVLKQLFDRIDNGSVAIIVDVFNYLNIDNYQEMNNIFDECLELFKDKIAIFHLKDFVLSNGSLKQVGLGKGIMDFTYMIPKIKAQCPNAYLIFEGSKPEDMQSGYNFIREKIMEA